MKKIFLILLLIIPVSAFAIKPPRQPPREAPASIPAVFERTTVVAGIHGYHYERQGKLYLNEGDVVATYTATVHDKRGKSSLEEKEIFRVPYGNISQVLLNDEAREAVLNGKLPTVPAGMWEYYATAYGLATKHFVSRPVIENMRGKSQDAVVILFRQDDKDQSVVMHTLQNYGPAIKQLIDSKKGKCK